MTSIILRRLSVLLLLSLLPFPVACQFREDVGVRQTEDADLIFTQHLLWATGGRSVASCATTCMSDQLCVSFTFTLTRNDSKGQGECRGHNAVDEAGDGQRSAGSRRYVLRARAHAVSSLLTTTEEPVVTTAVLDTTTILMTTTEEPVVTTEEPVASTNAIIVEDWLNRQCKDHSYCTVPNSECFANLCLCTPGFYYSVTTATCVSGCSSADLQDTFVAYPGYKITGHHIASGTVRQTLVECMALCLQYADPHCLSFDFDPSYDLPKCAPSDMAVADVDPDDWSVGATLTYYQRTCL